MYFPKAFLAKKLLQMAKILTLKGSRFDFAGSRSDSIDSSLYSKGSSYENKIDQGVAL